MISDEKNVYQVFQIPGKQWWVLLTQNGDWGMYKENQILLFNSIANAMPLLPLLEFSHIEAERLVQSGLKKTQIDSEIANTFPYELLLRRALTWPTEYWVSLALDWLENDYPVTEKITACLREALENNALSQRSRHRAKRLLASAKKTFD